MSKWGWAYEERGDFVSAVDCFAGSALFGFGVTCDWVGGWHCGWLWSEVVVVAIVKQHERESRETLDVR